MSVSQNTKVPAAYIESLAKQHMALDEKLHKLYQSPSCEDLEIVAVKRRKLHIKDKIQSCSR